VSESQSQSQSVSALDLSASAQYLNAQNIVPQQRQDRNHPPPDLIIEYEQTFGQQAVRVMSPLHDGLKLEVGYLSALGSSANKILSPIAHNRDIESHNMNTGWKLNNQNNSNDALSVPKAIHKNYTPQISSDSPINIQLENPNGPSPDNSLMSI
jgi:hypothetical protein